MEARPAAGFGASGAGELRARRERSWRVTTDVRKVSLLGGPGLKRLLALGAHADDIEIGCGGTLLRLAAEHRQLEVMWVVFSAAHERAAEARASAAAFLSGAARAHVEVREYRDGYFPYQGDLVKDDFEALKRDFDPDLVFTHAREDRHQDHRVISDLTWNTWRSHTILEYEVPKWDGDLATPNFYAHLTEADLERKIAFLLEHFPSQRQKHWFSADVFRALARLRGVECAAPHRYAEGFTARKVSF
jgi:LmbE family N-acetylglucosaminyl deacetylase